MQQKRLIRVRVLNAETEIGKYMCAALAELGYDVILGVQYKFLPPFDEFHNVIFDLNNRVKEFADFIFEAHERFLIIYDGPFLYKTSEVVVQDFVGFALYCWRMYRGDCYSYSLNLEVTPNLIREWKLRDII